MVILSLISSGTNTDEQEIKKNLKLCSELLEVAEDVSVNNKEEAEKLIWIKERLEQGVEIFKQDFNIACEESFR